MIIKIFIKIQLKTIGKFLNLRSINFSVRANCGFTAH